MVSMVYLRHWIAGGSIALARARRCDETGISEEIISAGGLSVSRGFFQFGADAVEFHDAPLEFVEEEVDDGRGEEGEKLGDEEAADDGDAEWLSQFGADTHADGER